ncbi:hypothetical protein F5X99DRAFT_397862 [Biscogniauxia marginata]|nr:hypothetical protein F5X99DRAFT_397862 [Biscogniauxia marginata]
MTTSTIPSLQALISRLPPVRFPAIAGNSNPQTVRTALGATAVLLPLLTYWTRCYLAWYSLGDGGLPHNFKGWLLNVAMHLFARSDHRAERAPYADRIGALTSSSPESLYGPAGAKSYFSPTSSASSSSSSSSSSSEEAEGKKADSLPPPPPRSGPRPDVPTTVAPQRQTTQCAPASTVEAQGAFLRALAAANPDLFSLKASGLESPLYTAVWLSGAPSSKLTVPAWFSPRAPGEFAHVHPEGSSHFVLSLVDAERIVARGWGERHRLSGGGRLSGEKSKRVLPWGFVLVYAPREGNGEEMKVWRDCVLASARFVAEAAGAGPGEEVVVVPEV